MSDTDGGHISTAAGKHPQPASGRARYRPRVVILGGGFAGLAALRRLRREPVDVVLVDRHAFNTFQPLLYQVATATLNPGDVTWALRSVNERRFGARFVLGDVETIDHEQRLVRLRDGRGVSYEYLVVATGVGVNFFGIEGAAEHSLPLYTRHQALALRDELQRLLEAAARDGQPEDVRVVIVGGGATGVETAGAMADMRERDLPVLFPELDRRRIHITVVEMLPHVLGPFSPGSRTYAAEALRTRGVDLRLGTAVKTVRADGVTIAATGDTKGDASNSSQDGESGGEKFVPAQLVVWASGIRVPDAVGAWGLPQGKGGAVLVDEHLRVRGLDRVFAAGDIALREDSPLPQQAQPALQTGRHVAEVIAADVAGADEPAFRYRDLGRLATIGRRDAVAEATHVPHLTGLPAWIVWNAVHIRSLLGGRNRLAAMVNLGAKYLFWSRDHNVIVGEPQSAGDDRVTGRSSGAPDERKSR